jgi:uncharacterized protein YkwD
MKKLLLCFALLLVYTPSAHAQMAFKVVTPRGIPYPNTIITNRPADAWQDYANRAVFTDNNGVANWTLTPAGTSLQATIQVAKTCPGSFGNTGGSRPDIVWNGTVQAGATVTVTVPGTEAQWDESAWQSRVVRDEMSAAEIALAQEINEVRRQNGVAAVPIYARANYIADRHIQGQAATGNYSHCTAEGTVAADRGREAGFLSPSYISENIWKGGVGQSAKTVVQTWMDSPGHRAGLLNPLLRGMGVAIGSGYYNFNGVVNNCINADPGPVSACTLSRHSEVAQQKPYSTNITPDSPDTTTPVARRLHSPRARWSRCGSRCMHLSVSVRSNKAGSITAQRVQSNGRSAIICNRYNSTILFCRQTVRIPYAYRNRQGLYIKRYAAKVRFVAPSTRSLQVIPS